MSRTGALDDLMRRGHRRQLFNLLLKQTVLAACVAMGGLILLLLLGTEILDWRWLAPLFLAGFLLGFRNLRRRMLSSYGMAQAIDKRLDLHDSLSTAYFYNRLGVRRKAPEEIRAAQLARAERLAREADLERAIPFAAPRSLYAMGVLGLIASSLFALRYGISRTLDLRPPLAKMVFDVFHFAEQPQKVAKKDQNQKRVDELLKQFGLSLDNEADKQPGQEGPQAPSLEGSEQAETRKDASGKPGRQGISVEAKSDSKEEADKSDPAASGLAMNGDQDPGASNQSGPQSGSEEQSARQRSAGAPTENNSLLDKFRDAMANLLSRLKSQPRQGDGQQMASNSQGRDESGQGRQQGQKGAQMGGKNSPGDPSGQPQGEQEGEGSQQAQAGSGKQSGNESQRASQEGRSGIGKEDGSKGIREAEQLAAMGKISEIIGKRSQSLTGEVMVEVASGNQQLRTAYSQQAASHSDTGGEIHRDEIPLAYQRYVQQYFEEIRKAVPPAAKPAPRAPEPPARP